MLTNVLLKRCWVALALLVVCIPILFVACQKSNDDYYAEARVRLVLPDSLRLEKLQGTVRLTNLNNKQSFTTSTFQAGEASLEVFRGVYAVDVEGSVRYAAPDGTKQTANFGPRFSALPPVGDEPTMRPPQIFIFTSKPK